MNTLTLLIAAGLLHAQALAQAAGTAPAPEKPAGVGSVTAGPKSIDGMKRLTPTQRGGVESPHPARREGPGRGVWAGRLPAGPSPGR
jgi:hypothetical protein